MISQQSVDEFQGRGVTLLRGVFADWVAPLRVGVEQNMVSPGPFGRTYTTPGQPGHFFGDYCNWDRIEHYRRFVFDSPAAQIAARLMASNEARFFHEHVLVKEPGTAQVTPWHHDQPYYCVDGSQTCSLWIPLDPVTQSVCPEFVAGSHRWGRKFLPRKFSGIDYDHTDTELESMPDIDADRDAYEICSWALQPGDAIAFSFLTVHGAPANQSTQRRRGFAARWVGDDARFARRSGEISPPYPGLAERLMPGDPLDDELFPQVWTQKDPLSY